jgi:hypothetical protein
MVQFSKFLCGSLFKYAKTYTKLPYLILLVASLQAETIGIIGGQDNDDATIYAALITSTGEITALSGNALPAGRGNIYSVAMSPSGTAIISGGDGGGDDPYVAFVSSTGVTRALTGALPAPSGGVYGVAISPSGAAIIGGQQSVDNPYVAVVSSAGFASALTGAAPSGVGAIKSVAITPSGNGIIGGSDNGSPGITIPYAALVSSTGFATPLTGVALPSLGLIDTVAIAPSGAAIIGGIDNNTSNPYVALVSSTGVATFPIGSALPSGQGIIQSVAIAPSGAAIIGGQQESNLPYVALISPAGATIALTGPALPSGTGMINSVAIAPSGAAIIGGMDNGGSPYAALVSSTGMTTLLTGPALPQGLGEIFSVAIAPSGIAIIGGQDNNTDPYVAIVSSTGMTLALTGPAFPQGGGSILSTAIILSLLVPTTSLSGNNLIYANYINEFASQNVFFFIPSILDGTYASALESAAPTRNAISMYTASNNLFNLTTSFSIHIRDQWASRIRNREEKTVQTSEASASIQINDWKSDNNLLASQTYPNSEREQKDELNKKDKSPYTIWFDTVGLLAYQKAQQQTPAFNPSTIGGILAFDAMIGENSQVGGGAAYLFTHIHEKQGAGQSNINQEDVFVYASWDNQRFYIDGMILAGPVQISQARKIQMTGFNFQSSSKPNGWQLIPHLELGWNQNHLYQAFDFSLNLFAMLDWANAWQGRYKEKGDGPFNIEQKAHYASLLRTEVGLRIYETIFFEQGNLIFQEKASYVNTQSFGMGKVNAFLVGFPGLFTVETLSSAQNLGVGQFAMMFQPKNGCYPSSTVFYQGEFGVQYQSHQVNLEFAWCF